MNRVTVVLGSQAGSCGKGKFVGYLAQADNFDAAINNFMSNTGHTYVDAKHGTIMTQHLPTSIVNDKTSTLCIGAAAAITPNILFNEIIKYQDIIGDRKIYIHPRAMVILPHHIEKEKEMIRSGSTFKGCGVAQAEKAMRVPGTKLFGEWFESEDWSQEIDHIYDITGAVMKITQVIEIADMTMQLNEMIDCKCSVLVEGSQGCDLDINFGLPYPNITSRQCHACQLVADCGLSPRLVDEIIMVMRPYPIRISNETDIGICISSGTYGESEELTWEEIKKRCGAPNSIQFGEMTTVTKKMRRVFEMNWDRLRYVTAINRPTQIALNFVQYIDYNALGCKKWSDLPQTVKDFAAKVEEVTGVKVTLIGTGAKNDEIIDRR